MRDWSISGDVHWYYYMIDCSCVRKRGKPPILPDLMHNSQLWKFINGRIIE